MEISFIEQKASHIYKTYYLPLQSKT